MILKMVTYDGDLTQFLVEARTDDEAIAKAIYANKEIDRELGASDESVNDPAYYEVDDVDFKLLCEIIEREDCYTGMFGEAKVFNG